MRLRGSNKTEKFWTIKADSNRDEQDEQDKNQKKKERSESTAFFLFLSCPPCSSLLIHFSLSPLRRGRLLLIVKKAMDSL